MAWQLCTAVVACAKICCDLMPSNGIMARRNFHRIWIAGKKNVSETGPWCFNPFTCKVALKQRKYLLALYIIPWACCDKLLGKIAFKERKYFLVYPIKTLKTESGHDANFVITGSTAGCRNNSVPEKLSWFIRHLSDELDVFYSDSWNLSSDIWA